MSEHEQLPDELAELFAAERTAPIADASARLAARSRLAAATAHTPLGQAAAGSVLGGAGKALAVLAITIAAGGSTVALLKHRDSPTIPPSKAPVSTVAREREAPVLAPPHAESESAPKARVSPGPSLGPKQAAISKRPSDRPEETPASPPAPEASQAQLLRRAWASLSAGQPAAALEIVRDDQARHPDGVLAEERDALTVQALVKLQRLDEARAAASGFIARYPNSVHRAQVERALADEETP